MSGYAHLQGAPIGGLRKPGPGFVIDPRTGRWVKKSTAAPAKTGAQDPYGAQSSFTDLQRAYLETIGRGPDYSGITPSPPDQYFVDRAGQMATNRIQPGIDSLQRDRGELAAQRKVSEQAATNFAAALASIFTGGKPGAEGEAYSLENFGGSYLAGVAAQMGTQLMGQIGHTFSERDFELRDQLSLLMDKYPAEAENIYMDLVKGEQERVSQGMSIADADFKTQLAALASAAKFERDNARDRSLDESRRRKDLLDATKALGGGGTEPRIIQTSTSTYAVDPATGQKLWEHKNPPKPASQRNPVTRKFGGATWQWNPQTRSWDLLARDPTKATAKEKASPSSVSETIARATKIGQTALDKVTDNVWAKMPGSGAERGTDEYAGAEAAYNSYLDSGRSFGTAMARVIAAIGPHLRLIGYKQKQIRQIAYQIVSQEISPPKGYRAPGAR